MRMTPGHTELAPRRLAACVLLLALTCGAGPAPIGARAEEQPAAEAAAQAPATETAPQPDSATTAPAAGTAAPAGSTPDNPATAAADPVAIPLPANPVALKAFQALEKNCSRCHQDGRLNRLRPAKNFGNILHLDEIAADPNLIQPGNPDASRLYKQIVKKEMPYDTYYEFTGAEPSADEVSAIRDWIASLGATQTAACGSRTTIGNGQIVNAVAADLQAQPDHRIAGLRYVTLANLYNACISDDQLAVDRQAVIKLLNSLSNNSDALRLATVDKEQTIIRFHLDDLAWDALKWEKLLAVYPYAAKPDVKLFDFVASATKTELPFVRGDWLAFAAARPPLYHDLLGLPKSFGELQKSLELSIEENLKKFLAKRAGFQISGVSRNNRLIERHTIKTGVLWTSYDFAGNQNRQSLFEHPLGPDGDNAFQHDGGESIYSLPNGFNAYYLSTAKGDRLDTGPTNIVQDTTQKDLSVTNGISCMGCHDQGFRKAKDEIRAHVAADRTFSKEVRDAVDALYPPHAEMDGLIDQDTKRFRDALQQAGLEPDAKIGGVEMINALSKQYEKDVNLAFAAAEFGITGEDFVARLAGAGGEIFRLQRRLEQGTVPRDTFEVAFKELLAKVTDDTFAVAQGVGKAETIGAKSEDSALSRDFELALFSDKSAYKVGDLAVFTVSTKKDCNLTLINVDAAGQGTVIFPNDFQRKNLIKAGEELKFPGAGAPFQFRLKDKGTEAVIAACNASGKEVDGIKHDFNKQQLTELGEYRSFVTRKIEVEQAAGGKPKKKSGEKTATEEAAATGKVSAKGDVLARTAIKFEVK